MRKIKYRIWDKKYQQFDDSCYYYIDMDGDIYLIEERNKSMMSYMHREEVSDRYEVMQYTGLTDRNGIEIYEGDVLSVQGGNEHQGYREFSETGNVEFSGAAFMFTYKFNGNKVYANFDHFDKEDTEVIGNIYEHPELLEG